MSNFVDLFNEDVLTEAKKSKSIKDKLEDKKKEISKKFKGKKSKDECGECNESFHFGPSFNSNYTDYALSEAEDNSYLEAAYDGSKIEDDDDPTEPTVDSIVNAEPDMAANYHFGPAFGQDIFTQKTLKHSRK